MTFKTVNLTNIIDIQTLVAKINLIIRI